MTERRFTGIIQTTIKRRKAYQYGSHIGLKRRRKGSFAETAVFIRKISVGLQGNTLQTVAGKLAERLNVYRYYFYLYFAFIVSVSFQTDGFFC